MSDSDKLRALKNTDPDGYYYLWAYFDQLLAVVEAAESVEFQMHDPWSNEYKAVTSSLAALKEALS